MTPILAIVLLCCGCQVDDRITFAQLNEMERRFAEEAPPIEPQQLALTDLRPYTIVPGDVLAITMFGLRDDRYEPVRLDLRVHDDGNITVPIVGPIAVTGRTLAQAEEAISSAHKTDVVKDLAVFVQLAGSESTTVLVQGAVATPGLIRLPENERNVLYALTSAGGFGPSGSGRVHLLPIRPERGAMMFNFDEINDVRRALSGPPLESGDVLVVESAEENAVYVTGLVNAPGPVAVPRDGTVSLVRTVAASGGLRDFLEPPEATLWRQLPDGGQVRVKIELAKIMAGESPDIAMRAGDILDVPHTGETRFREWFAANIRFGPFGMTAVYDPVADYRARLLRDDSRDVSINQSLLQTLVPGISDLLVPSVPAPSSP